MSAAVPSHASSVTSSGRRVARDRRSFVAADREQRPDLGVEANRVPTPAVVGRDDDRTATCSRDVPPRVGRQPGHVAQADDSRPVALAGAPVERHPQRGRLAASPVLVAQQRGAVRHDLAQVGGAADDDELVQLGFDRGRDRPADQRLAACFGEELPARAGIAFVPVEACPGAPAEDHCGNRHHGQRNRRAGGRRLAAGSREPPSAGGSARSRCATW